MIRFEKLPIVKRYFPLFISVYLVSCVGTSQLDNNIRDLQIPENWQSDNLAIKSNENWLSQLNQPVLVLLTEEGLAANQSLRQESYRVEILEQQLLQAEADFWPVLDLGITSSRNKSAINGEVSTRYSTKLESSYEVDLWGKLSDNQKNSHLLLLSAKAKYQQQKQRLVANIAKQWFSLITAKQLMSLFQQRVENARQSLDIIESGYKQGLNKALDVYLSRNELNSEISNLASQQANVKNSARSLEQLLGRYPSGKLADMSESGVPTNTDTQTLPNLPPSIPLGLPSEVLSRNPQLQAAWQQVLAQDANLAFAHKQRFPSIRLTASVSNSTTEISDLLSTNSLGWSLLSNLTAPIFNAGKLKANEEIARLRLKQQEQDYLTTLYQVFADVENAITNESSLLARYQATQAAQENASAAQTLAFEQYQRGLVSYTTVLNAQDRAFNAQSSLIQIQNQLLSNRVNLHLALGGDFALTSNTQQDDSNNE